MTKQLTQPNENERRAQTQISAPPKQGLYDPQFEHDACGLGFVVHIKGKKSHQLVSDALKILVNLDHRGAVSCEPNTGDGAGILIQVPHEFLVAQTEKLGFKLPAPGNYGVGQLFLPKNKTERENVKHEFAKIISDEGQTVLGWRDVPVDNSSLGKTAVAAEPFMAQVFVGKNPAIKDDTAFERKLFVIRKIAEQKIRYAGKIPGGNWFYVSSLSAHTLIYKGMLMSEQVKKYYPDLRDEKMVTALALVHSRFSTNTFPSWDRAHPNRYIAHNGEINTLRGNVNWMHAAQSNFKSKLFGDDIKKIIPVINTDGSDSAQFDNCVELLTLAGRELPHAMMMMIPEPWENHESMDAERRAFYEFHSCLMEPWDGPASMAFTDGKIIGACLDRNGLRPSRYYVTKDDLVIMASEAGVLEIPPERILQKGRLQPGRMFLVDIGQGRIVADEELKKKYAGAQPYQKWLNEHHVLLENLPEPTHATAPDHRKILERQQAFGYTFEDLRLLIAPMGNDGVQPLGSMGTDTPLAVLSNKPQLLYNYFKQLFAQVTNPPIDPIREEIITSTETMVGARGGLLNPTPESCALIKLKHPILTNEELEKLRHVDGGAFKCATLPILFEAKNSGAGILPANDRLEACPTKKNLEHALEKLFSEADKAIASGANILLLSDRNISPELAPIPALLAVSGLHHHLIRKGTRGKIGLVLESGEPREVHHFALLIGYGCSAINPYLAFATLDDLIQQG
ncbi:MAG: glutamate synthase central domain-containing protein, partial [Limisphaerales bacterium]